MSGYCYRCGEEIEFRVIDGQTRPMGCQCGSGGSGWSDSNTSSYASYPFTRCASWASDHGDHGGNSKCPWCGEQVWFVRHNGGCVYLDGLGPPWPVHACFDDYRSEIAERSRLPTHVPVVPAAISRSGSDAGWGLASIAAAERRAGQSVIWIVRPGDFTLVCDVDGIFEEDVGTLGFLSLRKLDFVTARSRWIHLTSTAILGGSLPKDDGGRERRLAPTRHARLGRRDAWTVCPECRCELLKTSLETHIARVHGHGPRQLRTRR